MSKSKNPNAVRSRIWRAANKEKCDDQRIRDAYRLLMRCGIIDGDKVLTDPTKR